MAAATSALRTLLGATGAADQEIAMLRTLAVVLLVLWALGFVSSYTMGGFVHVLLVVAVVVVLVDVIQGRRLRS